MVEKLCHYSSVCNFLIKIMQRYSFRNKWHSETEKDINILLLIVHENEAVWAIITADGYISGLKMVFS